MKNHIALKFLAILLAALTLLTVLGSAAGIVTLTVADLYDRTVDELYEENTESERRNFAVNLIHRYASLNLGNLPEGYLDAYHGASWQWDTFAPGYFFYNILDENGNVVESTLEGDLTGATRYEIFVTDLQYRRLIPEDAQALQPKEGEEPEDVSDAVEAVDSDVFEDGYYDYEKDTYVTFRFQYVDLPPYTVELYLLPGALAEEYMWTLLETVWNFRNTLFYVLGGSLLLFAALAVYLCCAAARRPGSTDVRAAGLNCIPLDLYALGGGGAICVILLLSIEVLEYLLWEGSSVLIYYAAFAGFGICLILVCFGFACAAQFKTPGGYWYRNTLMGRLLRLSHRFGRWLERFLGKKCFPALGRGCRKLWSFGIGAVLWSYRIAKELCLRLCRGVGGIFRWIREKIHRFLSLMPLTWQWLVTGFFLILVLMFCISTRDGFWMLIGFALTCAAVLYGAHSFGILMESTKRMGKGDLETKIQHDALVGSFREFAGDLNALADVAMVAAQDKLKSERMKTELITNVSHDIKTPLTSIINYVDLMEKPHTPQEQDAYIEVLSRQSQRLKKLIDDLMEMSKASSGNISVELGDVDAVEAVNQALGEFGDKLEKVSLTPVLRSPETPLMMKADGKLVWRVLSNLLSNAVKYALPGTRLYIDVMELEGKVIISLKNISREPLNVSAEELMERFVRGDTSRNTEGSGLGLNIAQSLMELQKGQLQITVDGDLFKVTLTFPVN